jgi:Leucine-rich repeat (LRR) protein
MSRRHEWLYTNGLRLALMVSCFGLASTNLGWSIAEFEVTSNVDDINAAKKRLVALGPTAKVTMDGTRLTEIVIQDGSLLTSDDLTLFGRLKDLKKLQIFNCRTLNTEMAAKLNGLKDLTTLALTNTVIDDAAIEAIAKSFPKLTELDLSSNANMSSQVLKSISELKNLQRLSLVQNRFNELSTRRLSKLQDLQVVDLRGNMEAGDMTLEVLAALPKLKALKHRSTAVSDYGMELLSRNGTIENLLIQDFAITNQSGAHLAKLKKLSQLEIFRCQGFGSEGVLALKGLNLQRLTLRDLPIVDDQALECHRIHVAKCLRQFPDLFLIFDDTGPNLLRFYCTIFFLNRE